MIKTTKHKLDYGTLLSVVRIHHNRKGYMATVAEAVPEFPVYVPFNQCEDA